GVHGRLSRLVSILFSAISVLPDAACVRFSRHVCHGKNSDLTSERRTSPSTGLKGLGGKLARQHGRLFNVSKRTQDRHGRTPHPTMPQLLPPHGVVQGHTGS